jgi:hypothetical protein
MPADNACPKLSRREPAATNGLPAPSHIQNLQEQARKTWNSGKPGVSAAGKIVPSLIAWAACARAGKSAGASGRFLGCNTCANHAVTGDDFIHQY